MKKIAILACAWLAGAAYGQDLHPALQVKAIVGATVQVNPTTVLVNATVLIKGSVIVAVGTDVKVPAGADVIDGKGLTVYAGFIDAWTTKGQATAPERPRQDTPPDTTADIVSMMRLGAATNRADLLGADLFNPDDDTWRSERVGGFTTALVTPSTGVVVGQPSLMALDGKPRRVSTLVPSAGVALKFSRGFGGFGGGGGAGAVRQYPLTPLGFYATARQALFDAQHQQQEAQAYAAGFPVPPDDDPALAALAKPLPFLIEANTMPEIDRTLDFGSEFSRPTVVLGGTEGYKIIPKLKTGAKGAILTLDFGPEPIPAARPSTNDDFGFPGQLSEAETAADESSNSREESGSAGQNPTTPQTPAQGRGRNRTGQTQAGQTPGQTPAGAGRRRGGGRTDPDEPLAKKKENEAQWLEKVGNAAAFEKAGILFALSTEGAASTDEFFTNLRRAVKEGLSKPAALAALTTNPARMFGVSKAMGTVEVGKAAYLTILTSDVFSDGAKVKVLFIGGNKIDPAKVSVDFTPAPRFGEEE